MQSAPIRFTGRNTNGAEFFSVLRKRVDAYFTENKLSKHWNRQMLIKTIVLMSGYLIPFVCILVFQPAMIANLLLWSLMGVSVAGVGMCVMHDANHSAYSSNATVNRILGLTLNLLGGSVFNWKIQHNVMHHTYTNIASHDYDVQDKAVLRFSPHTKVKWYHKLQFLYAIPFYGILTLYWTLLKDYVQFFKYRKEKASNYTPMESVIMFLRITAGKLGYYFVFMVLPVVILGIPFWYIFSGFLLMHFIAGVILTLVFQLAHSVEGTDYPLACENGTVDNAWALHQMATTVNFSTKSRPISWFVGGLNFQVEHHLFPAICHVHYFDLAPIVKQTAEEFGVPYLENETLFSALGSHFRTLRNLGELPSLNEAIG
ncbi:MAG: fatty acid desaturase family protein [Bacteroidia bacterium]